MDLTLCLQHECRIRPFPIFIFMNIPDVLKEVVEQELSQRYSIPYGIVSRLLPFSRKLYPGFTQLDLRRNDGIIQQGSHKMYPNSHNPKMLLLASTKLFSRCKLEEITSPDVVFENETSKSTL